MKNFGKFFKLFVLMMVIVVGTAGCGLKVGNSSAMNELNSPITLKYWRVFDGQDSFDEIIRAYQQKHPNVRIEYRKLRYEEYEQALVEAWAEDRGPDIFTIHNSWVPKYESKIEAMPESLKLAYVVERDKRSGDIKKADYKETRALTGIDIRNNFAEVVYGDVVRKNKIWGLPLSVDSLALFYNRRMLDNAQITKVPTTWVEVKDAIKKLTVQDEAGNIVQAGIALGAVDNINRAVDILSLLMMQNGTQMIDASGRRATFNLASPYNSDKSYIPGMEALRFYTDFAMPSKEVYSWNKDMDDAVTAFTRGKVAMMLGYSYQLPLIKTQGAKINMGVAEVPHINIDGTDALGDKVNMASYWVETVSKKTEYKDYAWDFLTFATSAEQVKKYLDKTKKPTALRSLVSMQLEDYDIRPFAAQTLTAKSWYHGRNASAMNSILGNMIKSVVEGKNTPKEAIEFAASRVNQTF